MEKERKSEQAYIPHAPTMLDNASHNDWHCHALVMGNRNENHNRTSVLILIGYI